MGTNPIQTNPSLKLGAFVAPFEAEPPLLDPQKPVFFAMGLAALEDFGEQASQQISQVVQSPITRAAMRWGVSEEKIIPAAGSAVTAGGALVFLKSLGATAVTAASAWAILGAVVLGGAGGVGAGLLFNWGFEKIAGKSFGEKIYEWFHPDEEALKKNQIVIPVDPEEIARPERLARPPVLIEQKSAVPGVKTINVTASAKKGSGGKKEPAKEKSLEEEFSKVISSLRGIMEESLPTKLDALAAELKLMNKHQSGETFVEFNAARERASDKIYESVELIMKGGSKKGEKEFQSQMDELLLHPSPFVRDEALRFYISSTGADNLIPDFFEKQKPLIERDLTSSDTNIISDACRELDWFVRKGVEGAIKMFSDLANSKNPTIQSELEFFKFIQKAKSMNKHLMEEPEGADAGVIRRLEEEVYRAQKSDKKITDYVERLENIAHLHPNENIRTLAKASLGRIEDSSKVNLEALASLELDMDQLWKALDKALVERERDLIKIREWVLLIMKVGSKKGEKEFGTQMDKFSLHPSPFVRLEALQLYIHSTGAKNMIPYFWERQKSLIERDLSSLGVNAWDACAELEQFMKWDVKEAEKMFIDLADSKNSEIQFYVQDFDMREAIEWKKFIKPIKKAFQETLKRALKKDQEK